ncbi:MAG TPA: M20/M25/M40 family metallo-hydrolase [Candidatus Nitrosocosmicus sp.]|nr:M20/M25/M40 family metallo-hydrolase [Candidatus Nitrosocosmicus sp.]
MLLSASLNDEQMQSIITDLQVLIRQPSISATCQGLKECATLLSKIMANAGIKSELLRLNVEDQIDNVTINPVPPVVFGEVRSKSNPQSKTLLFYNHYDVQPVDPIEKWNEDPFSGKVIGNQIFGRGSADDKGELITRLKAVEFFLKETGDVPCNIKFLIEGEEEIGSPNLGKYIQKFKDKLQTDLVIWESGYVDMDGRAIVSLGQKGILNTEIKVHGPSRDIHSSLAVAIPNPAWKLIELLSALYDSKRGDILIGGWCEDVIPIKEKELQLLADEPFNEEAFKKEYGFANFINNQDSYEVKKALAIEPTCNISGLISGYTNSGIKTILPATATAKMDFRLVPNMNPQKQFEKLVSFIRSLGYSQEQVSIKYLSGEPAYKTPIDNPYVKMVVESASKIFNGIILNISSPGTGPMYLFKEILNVDSICIGSTILPNKLHSPNEYAELDLLNKGTKCFIEIIKNFTSVKKNQI